MDISVFTIVIYTLLIIHPTCGHTMNSTFKEKIIGFLQELCPRSGVCSNENSDNQSCCRACSCTPDCYDDNCCFPEEPENLSDVTLYPQKRHHSQCLYPFSEPPEDASIRVVYQSYYMVTSSPSEKPSPAVPCGDIQVASWGSMYPVSSRIDGTIYKNRFCAEENNVTDFEIWDGYLVCGDKNAGLTASLYDGIVPKTCRIQFEYDNANIGSDICYVREDYVNICWKDEFTIPSITTASKDEIITACTSGTMSPYTGFANVFCNICSGVPLDTCVEYDNEYKGTFGQPGFTSFIDPRYLHSYHEDEADTRTIPKQNLNTACIVNNVQHDFVREGCRRISCPSGQIYDAANTCVYPGNKWSIKMIMVQLELTSEQPFSIIPLSKSVESLKSPFSDGWYINIVVYWGKHVNNTLSSIIVVQTLNFRKPFKPATILKRIRKAVNEPWLFETGNGTITLNAKLYGRPILGHELIYSSKDYDIPMAVPITNLYFCEQVVLYPWEYVENHQEISLTNFITNNTVYESEFTWIETINGTSPSICLDMSGLQRAPSSNAQAPAPRSSICLILALLITALKIIFQ